MMFNKSHPGMRALYHHQHFSWGQLGDKGMGTGAATSLPPSPLWRRSCLERKTFFSTGRKFSNNFFHSLKFKRGVGRKVEIAPLPASATTSLGGDVGA